MCLDTIDKEIKKTKGFGWKVFEERARGLHPAFFDLPYSKPFKVNVWVTETRNTLRINGYDAGFHVFEKEADANLYLRWRFRIVTRKVKYDNVVATGKQSGLKVIVARKIFIEDK